MRLVTIRNGPSSHRAWPAPERPIAERLSMGDCQWRTVLVSYLNNCTSRTLVVCTVLSNSIHIPGAAMRRVRIARPPQVHPTILSSTSSRPCAENQPPDTRKTPFGSAVSEYTEFCVCTISRSPGSTSSAQMPSMVRAFSESHSSVRDSSVLPDGEVVVDRWFD